MNTSVYYRGMMCMFMGMRRVPCAQTPRSPM